MGWFSKLFGNNGKNGGDNPDLNSSSEALDEDLYWKIVAESLKKSKNQDEQEQLLLALLQQLRPTQIIGFKLQRDQFLQQTYTSEMWCAAYIINGGCSDDGFEYFRNWLISKGKDVYYKAKGNPDSLVNHVGTEDESYEFESFSFVPIDAFSKTTGKELYDYIDNSTDDEEGINQEIEFTWKEEDPESYESYLPCAF